MKETIRKIAKVNSCAIMLLSLFDPTEDGHGKMD